MVTFRQWGNRWQEQVRRMGQQPESKPFFKRSEAGRWARESSLRLTRQLRQPLQGLSDHLWKSES
jgi:hypothetical protein